MSVSPREEEEEEEEEVEEEDRNESTKLAIAESIFSVRPPLLLPLLVLKLARLYPKIAERMAPVNVDSREESTE